MLQERKYSFKNYKGYVSTMKFILGKSKRMIMNEAFRNEYLTIDRLSKNPFNNLGINGEESKKISRKRHKDKIIKFVNVFDLMFSIKCISRNKIVVCQNNISSALGE